MSDLFCFSWPGVFAEFLAVFDRVYRNHSHDSDKYRDSSSGLLGSALVSIFAAILPRVDMESFWESPGEHVRHY